MPNQSPRTGNGARKWWLGLAIAAAAIGVWQGRGWFTDQRSAAEGLVNQIWIERMPRDARDMIWHLIAVEHDEHRFGSLGRSSRWRVAADAFIWQLQGDQFKFVTPQNGCKSDLKARVWKCAGEAPKPFELCLELVEGDHRFRFYSRPDWVIRPRGEIDEQTREDLGFLAPALLAALAPPEGEPPAGAPAATESCPPLGRSP